MGSTDSGPAAGFEEEDADDADEVAAGPSPLGGEALAAFRFFFGPILEDLGLDSVLGPGWLGRLAVPSRPSAVELFEDVFALRATNKRNEGRRDISARESNIYELVWILRARTSY